MIEPGKGIGAMDDIKQFIKLIIKMKRRMVL